MRSGLHTSSLHMNCETNQPCFAEAGRGINPALLVARGRSESRRFGLDCAAGLLRSPLKDASCCNEALGCPRTRRGARDGVGSRQS